MATLMTTTIIDYDRQDDVMRFETGRELRFVGVSETSEDGGVSYYRNGDDTIVEAGLFADVAPLEIVLVGYTGNLTASDFDLG